MELERYKEISKWFNETFPDEPLLKEKILDKITEIFQKLLRDYYLDYKDNPNFVLINEILTHLVNHHMKFVPYQLNILLIDKVESILSICLLSLITLQGKLLQYIIEHKFNKFE